MNNATMAMFLTEVFDKEVQAPNDTEVSNWRKKFNLNNFHSVKNVNSLRIKFILK
jgi:hypothetical protein